MIPSVLVVNLSYLLYQLLIHYIVLGSKDQLIWGFLVNGLVDN